MLPPRIDGIETQCLHIAADKKSIAPFLMSCIEIFPGRGDLVGSPYHSRAGGRFIVRGFPLHNPGGIVPQDHTPGGSRDLPDPFFQRSHKSCIGRMMGHIGFGANGEIH